ncbi:Thioesterase superfamily protein [Rhodospirillaceae bacterium LM-1]|nr:Thioesterase superfamily protein [Rhodospirillaceae bacterium LM-1]
MTQAQYPAIIAAKLLERDQMARLLGVELVEVDLGRCVVKMTFAGTHLNGYGGGHGGAIFSLADVAFAIASNSRGHMAVGIDAHIAYFVGVKEGDVLYARASEINRSRRLGTYRIDIERADGVLAAAFTGTVSVSEKPAI